VVHGFPEFVYYLEEEGFDAEPLGEEASFVKQHRKKK